MTGSNAKMLSSEIATTLGGRFLIQEVYPYSFREFLLSQDIILKQTGFILQVYVMKWCALLMLIFIMGDFLN